MAVTVPPSRDVWCAEILATCAEMDASTDAGTHARGLMAIAELCTHRPADVTPQELLTVVAPLAAHANAFLASVAGAGGTP
ncbi:MAG TPA: hypothetical protein VM142_01610 [Acidimicrobiales bacterium]|nr:hypothetical protein [Acidimicrobiales bacterium]